MTTEEWYRLSWDLRRQLVDQIKSSMQDIRKLRWVRTKLKAGSKTISTDKEMLQLGLDRESEVHRRQQLLNNRRQMKLDPRWEEVEPYNPHAYFEQRWKDNAFRRDGKE